MLKLKDEIIKLRKLGLTYNQIKNKLNCSKGVISFHCSKLNINSTITKKNNTVRKAKIQKNKKHHKEKRVIKPTPKFKHESSIIYLIETGSSRKIIADALSIPYKDLILFSKRKNIKSRKDLKGYKKLKQHRRNKKILASLYLGGECKKCGYNKSYSALDFHHRIPSEKEMTISKCISLSWDKIKAEIKKCDLLCSNCHREEHDHWL